MAGKIPQRFIDDLLDRVDIVDIVASRIDLKKTGKNHSACCPFHDEKTPSFTVSPDKQFFYCFGCGAGGNAIGFVMDYDQVSFPEAVETLAKHTGMEVPREAGERDSQATAWRKQLYQILDQSVQFFRQSLKDHHFAFEAVHHLKARGMKGETARDFGIGFAPPGWDNMIKHFGNSDTTIKLLKQSGMIIEQVDTSRTYDRFRHRIMFPIRDMRGRTVGFGGRVLGDEKPKYLNTPETPLYHKGRELYGLYEANKASKDLPFILVVEGYMDVIMLSQHGIKNVVAALGTSATTEQMEKLFRYSAEIIFCFDGDSAGRGAADRALHTALPLMIDGRSTQFLFLPEGQDPDTLVREQGAEKFLEFVQTALPISEFFMQKLCFTMDNSTPDKRAKMWQQAAPLIKRMPPGIFRELMLRTVAEKIGLDVNTLGDYLPKEDGKSPNNTPRYASENTGFDGADIVASPSGNNPPVYDASYDASYDFHNHSNGHSAPDGIYQETQQHHKKVTPLVYRLIALLANVPTLVKHLPDKHPLFDKDAMGADLLKPLAQLLRDNPEYSLNHILGYWRGVYDSDQVELLTQIIASDLLSASADNIAANEQEFLAIIHQLDHRLNTDMSPMEVLQFLADKPDINDQDIKQLNHAWTKLPKEQLNEETKSLFNQIFKRNK